MATRRQVFLLVNCFVALAYWVAFSCSASFAAEPRAFTTMSVITDGEALRGAHDVELQGNLAFVPGKGGSLSIIDIADPKQPKIMWSRRDEQALGDAETVLPAGNFLFLGTQDFHALDIRDPTKAKFVHTIRDRKRIDRINGFARKGNLLFAANKEGWINAFDISSPDRPKLRAALNIAERDGISKPHDIDLLGDLLVVVDPAGFGRRMVPGHVGIYRVFNQSSGTLLSANEWELIGKGSDERLVGGNRVRTLDKFAYVAASVSPQAPAKPVREPCLVCLDLTRPEQPRVVATVPFPDIRGPNGMEAIGNVVFVSGGQTIMAVDVSDPARPQLLAAEKCHDVFQGNEVLDDGHDLKYRDGYLYVSGQTSHSFGILKVNDERIRKLARPRGT